MRHNRSALFAWIAFSIVNGLVIATFVFSIIGGSDGDSPLKLLRDNVWQLVPLTFALVGALIVSRQPRNAIGLLLLLPAFMQVIPVDSYLAQFPDVPPSNQTLALLASWFQNWSWLLLIVPILFILLLFPTGRPPTPRWRWLIYLGLGVGAVYGLGVIFARELGPMDGNWTLHNPIGIVSQDKMLSYLNIPLTGSLLLVAVSCAAAPFVRFRRAGAVERQQIKWLFAAAALFALVYVPGFFNGASTDSAGLLWNFLFLLAILGIPIAIGIAILRYRLYDIDIIIRRTLQYTVLTGLLALIYSASVVLLQSLFEALTGQQSPIVIVVSTLAIAALFSPLRLRVKNVVDRRFFRRQYDAQQTLAAFAAVSRDEVDLDALSAALLGAVEGTMHPERVLLWLRDDGEDQRWTR
jgi:hypothetical protein